ncbi:unnamed protein product, partial [Tilletia caries]
MMRTTQSARTSPTAELASPPQLTSLHRPSHQHRFNASSYQQQQQQQQQQHMRSSRSAPTSPRLALRTSPLENDSSQAAQFAHRRLSVRRVKRGSSFTAASSLPSDQQNTSTAPHPNVPHRESQQQQEHRILSPPRPKTLLAAARNRIASSSLTATPEASDDEVEELGTPRLGGGRHYFHHRRTATGTGTGTGTAYHRGSRPSSSAGVSPVMSRDNSQTNLALAPGSGSALGLVRDDRTPLTATKSAQASPVSSSNGEDDAGLRRHHRQGVVHHLSSSSSLSSAHSSSLGSGTASTSLSNSTESPPSSVYHGPPVPRESRKGGAQRQSQGQGQGHANQMLSGGAGKSIPPVVDITAPTPPTSISPNPNRNNKAHHHHHTSSTAAGQRFVEGMQAYEHSLNNDDDDDDGGAQRYPHHQRPTLVSTASSSSAGTFSPPGRTKRRVSFDLSARGEEEAVLAASSSSAAAAALPHVPPSSWSAGSAQRTRRPRTTSTLPDFGGLAPERQRHAQQEQWSTRDSLSGSGSGSASSPTSQGMSSGWNQRSGHEEEGRGAGAGPRFSTANFSAFMPVRGVELRLGGNGNGNWRGRREYGYEDEGEGEGEGEGHHHRRSMPRGGGGGPAPVPVLPRSGSRSAPTSRRPSSQTLDELYRGDAVRSPPSSSHRRTQQQREPLLADGEDIDGVYGSGSGSVGGVGSPPPTHSLAAAVEVGANAGARARAFFSGLGLGGAGPGAGAGEGGRFASGSGSGFGTRNGPALPPSFMGSGSRASLGRRPVSSAGVGMSWGAQQQREGEGMSSRSGGTRGYHHQRGGSVPFTASIPGQGTGPGAGAGSRGTSSSFEHTYESLYGTQHHIVSAGNAALSSAQTMSEEALLRTMSVAQMQLASAGNLALTLTRQLSEPLRPMFHVALLIGISSFTLLSLIAFMSVGYGLSVWDDVSRRATGVGGSGGVRARKNVEASVRWGKRMLAGSLESAFVLGWGSAALDESINGAAASGSGAGSPRTGMGAGEETTQGWSAAGAGSSNPTSGSGSGSGAGFSRASGGRRMRTGSMPSHVPWGAMHAQNAPLSPGATNANAGAGAGADGPKGATTATSSTSDEYAFHPATDDDPSPSSNSTSTSTPFPPRPPLSVLIPSIMLTLMIAFGATLVRMFVQRAQDAKLEEERERRTASSSQTEEKLWEKRRRGGGGGSSVRSPPSGQQGQRRPMSASTGTNLHPNSNERWKRTRPASSAGYRAAGAGAGRGWDGAGGG